MLRTASSLLLPMNRRHFSQRLFVATGLLPPRGLAFASTAVRAQALVEGQTYVKLDPPQPPLVPGKIDVIEFFSYACPHCNAFEPDLEAWAQKLPADVVFRRVPVPFLVNAANFQRTYYALESMGLVDSLQRKIFAAVHMERRRLDKPEDIAELVGRNGGDAAKFLATFQSFSIATSLNKARKMTTDYGVDRGPGVPALVVQGRYLSRRRARPAEARRRWRWWMRWCSARARAPRSAPRRGKKRTPAAACVPGCMPRQRRLAWRGCAGRSGRVAAGSGTAARQRAGGGQAAEHHQRGRGLGHRGGQPR